jgi:hypothetical protein
MNMRLLAGRMGSVPALAVLARLCDDSSAGPKTPKNTHRNTLAQNKNANTGILERRDFREVNYHTV